MKILQVLVLILALVVIGKGQACILRKWAINVTDGKGQIVENAQIRLFDEQADADRHFNENTFIRWNEEKRIYEGAHGLCASPSRHKNLTLTISAEGFELYEETIDLPKQGQILEIILRGK